MNEVAKGLGELVCQGASQMGIGLHCYDRLSLIQLGWSVVAFLIAAATLVSKRLLAPR